MFIPSEAHLLNPFLEGAALIGFSIDSLSANTTASRYSKDLTTSFASSGFRLVDSNSTDVPGNHSYENIYAMNIPNSEQPLQTWEKGIIVGNNVYILSYSSEPSVFEKYLPIADKAKRSLKISSGKLPLNQFESGLKTYQNEQYGFQLEYSPSTWQLDENFEIPEIPGIDNPSGISTPLALYARSESRFDLEI